MSNESPLDRDDLLEHFADTLLSAVPDGHVREDPGTFSIGDLTLDEAYAVQARLIAKRVERGESPVGYKVGCTSRAIREQFGLEEPVMARLMAPHVHEGEVRLQYGDYVDCAVEAEMVFRIGREVPPDFPSRSLLEVIESVRAGIEIHNYHFWYGRPTTQELVASNAIHAGLVMGREHTSPEAVDFEMEGVGLFVDGSLVASGISAETMGNPLRSLQWLVKKLAAQGSILKAGDLVIPGSPVKLVPVARGNVVTSRFTHCGSARAEFV